MAQFRPGVLDRVLEPYSEYGPLFIRLVVAYRLVWGTADNVFGYDRMLEFSGFLAGHGVPMSLVAAFVSVYAQFICGLLFAVGAFTRLAAAVMVVNFTVALLLVHVGQPFLENYDAFVMLFGAVFLLLHGPGLLSVDKAIVERRRGE